MRHCQSSYTTINKRFNFSHFSPNIIKNEETTITTNTISCFEFNQNPPLFVGVATPSLKHSKPESAMKSIPNRSVFRSYKELIFRLFLHWCRGKQIIWWVQKLASRIVSKSAQRAMLFKIDQKLELETESVKVFHKKRYLRYNRPVGTTCKYVAISCSKKRLWDWIYNVFF